VRHFTSSTLSLSAIFLLLLQQAAICQNAFCQIEEASSIRADITVLGTIHSYKKREPANDNDLKLAALPLSTVAPFAQERSFLPPPAKSPASQLAPLVNPSDIQLARYGHTKDAPASKIISMVDVPSTAPRTGSDTSDSLDADSTKDNSTNKSGSANTSQSANSSTSTIAEVDSPSPAPANSQAASPTFADENNLPTQAAAQANATTNSQAQDNSPFVKAARAAFKAISSSDAPWTGKYPDDRGLPAPLDPIFPSTEYIGICSQLPIGVPDGDPEYPLERAIWKACPLLKKYRIKVYGWANPGVEFSTSHHSNYPLSYNIIPNRLEMDQLIHRVERVPDTVQTDHMDWGFRYTGLFGLDYRLTTSQGWGPASNELLKHNYLYGFDPVEIYGMVYVPKVFDGMVVKFGRYISPPDIEAQLAPDNYLYTHSLMFTVDCYTQTGVLTSIKLNKQLTIQAGICAGDDIAPWNRAAIPTAVGLIRYVTKSNNDSIYGGCTSVNNGQFRGTTALLQAQAQAAALGTSTAAVPAHDNLQEFNCTWTHRFNKKGTILTSTEGYVLYSFNAFEGGTVNNGPPRTFDTLTGPGTFIHGTSPVGGIVNYTVIKLSKHDFLTIRPIDYLIDEKGERTGFATTYASWTIGITHRFSNMLCFRPEIRYERALDHHVNPYDNGTRRSQFTFACDLIQRF
jgi:hypothetical protein